MRGGVARVGDAKTARVREEGWKRETDGRKGRQANRGWRESEERM